MIAPDQTGDEARYQLEDALAKISDLADLLERLGEHQEKGASGLVYLAHRLSEHHDEAHDAFSRIYGLDEYNNQPDNASAGGVA